MQSRRLRRAAVSSPGVEHRTRDEKTKSAHDEWRDRLDGIPDREVGGSPDQIDGSERSDDLRARSVGAVNQTTDPGASASCSSVASWIRASLPSPRASAWL